MSVGLLLVDIQNDYFPGGKMELAGSESAGQKARELLMFFREKKMPVFHIQHLSLRPGATFFIPNTSGADIYRAVEPQGNEPVVQKKYPNSFRETKLLSLLKEQGISKLVVAGMMTHMCVDATVRAAMDYGFQCLIAKDACATAELKLADYEISAVNVHMAFLAALNGIYGQVMNSQDIIKTLSEKTNR